jgi:hypothetical protein
LLAIFMWNQARSLVRICRPHLPKVPRAPSLFEHFEALLQFCALFVGNFPRLRPATAETETLLRRPWSHIARKNRVLRPKAFSSVNSCAPDSSTGPTCELLLLTFLLVGMMNTWWRDNGIMITWWHDEKTAPGHLSVTRQFSNYTSFDIMFTLWNTSSLVCFPVVVNFPHGFSPVSTVFPSAVCCERHSKWGQCALEPSTLPWPVGNSVGPTGKSRGSGVAVN